MNQRAKLTEVDKFLIMTKRPSGSTSKIWTQPAALELLLLLLLVVEEVLETTGAGMGVSTCGFFTDSVGRVLRLLRGEGVRFILGIWNIEEKNM